MRRQTYAGMGKQETNPADGHGENRMAMGHMAELLIVRDLHRNGWRTDHTVLSPGGQLTLEFRLPGTDLRARGHPDGICAHDKFTRGLWVPMEAKSMGVEKALQVQDMGIAQVYPDYMSQISLYGRKLYQQGLVSHPEKGVFAMMDRDGRPMPPERVGWGTEFAQQNLDRMAEAAGHVEAGTLPERPFGRGSKECGFCPYFSLCWGEMPRNWRDRRSVQTQDPGLLEAARTWEKLDPVVKEAKAMLQQASDREDGANIVADGVVAGYFHPREPKYDPGLLEKLVPADILRRCAPEPSQKDAFWVRKQRRG